MPELTISVESFREAVDRRRQEAMMVGSSDIVPEFTGTTDLDVRQYIQLLAGSNPQAAMELSGLSDTQPDELPALMQEAEALGYYEGNPMGGFGGKVLGAIGDIGNYFEENPAMWFALPFAVAGITGAFGATAGAAGSAGEGLSEIALPASVAPTGAVASGLGPSLPASMAGAGTAAAAGFSMGPGTAGLIGTAANTVVGSLQDNQTLPQSGSLQDNQELPLPGTGGGGGGLPNLSELGSGSNWIDLLTSGLQTLLGNNAIQGATEDQERAIGEAIDVQDSALDKTIPLFEPYRLAGESALQKILGMSGLPGGTTFDIKQDPSYQFRLDESMKALESSAAAKGGLLSGDFANTALQRAGEYASTEYTNIYNRLANLVNLGTNAASNEAAAYSGHASNVSNLLVGRGEASAYGKIGSGNQLMDLASSVGDYLSTRSQSPATGTNRSSYGG